jgi:hypothetical protein
VRAGGQAADGAKILFVLTMDFVIRLIHS